MIEAVRDTSVFKGELPAGTPTRPLLLDEVGHNIEEQSVLEFFTVGGLGRAVLANKWSTEAEIQVLMSIASDDREDAKDRMEALREIRKLMMQTLTLRGAVHKMDATKQEGDMTLKSSSVRLDTRGVETERLLAGAQSTQRVLNALPSHLANQEDGDQHDEDEIAGGFTKRSEEDLESFDPDALPQGLEVEDDRVGSVLRELDVEGD